MQGLPRIGIVNPPYRTSAQHAEHPVYAGRYGGLRDSIRGLPAMTSRATIEARTYPVNPVNPVKQGERAGRTGRTNGPLFRFPSPDSPLPSTL
jgi:hypothetical protein